jgi:hypothetical protein
LLNLLISSFLVIGGFIAYRHGFARTVNEVQERVINALQNELQTLQDRIKALEQGNRRLEHIIATICSALKARGIHITIDGSMVSIHDRLAEDGSIYTGIYDEQEGARQASGDALRQARTPEQWRRGRRRRRSSYTQKGA